MKLWPMLRKHWQILYVILKRKTDNCPFQALWKIWNCNLGRWSLS